MYAIVHLKRLTDNVRNAPLMLLPIFVAQEQNGWRSRLIVRGSEIPAQDRLHAERAEEAIRHNAGAHATGLSLRKERECHAVIFHQLAQRSTLIAVIANFGNGKTNIQPGLLGAFVEHHQLIALLVRQRL